MLWRKRNSCCLGFFPIPTQVILSATTSKLGVPNFENCEVHTFVVDTRTKLAGTSASTQNQRKGLIQRGSELSDGRTLARTSSRVNLFCVCLDAFCDCRVPCPHQRNATPNCPTGRRPGHSSSTHWRHEELQTLRFGQAHLREECIFVNWVVPPAMFRAIDLFRVLVGERSERGVSTQAIGWISLASSAPRLLLVSAFRADQGFCDRSDRCTPDESVQLRYHAGVRSGFAWTLCR